MMNFESKIQRLMNEEDDILVGFDESTEQGYAFIKLDGQIHMSEITKEQYDNPQLICRCHLINEIVHRANCPIHPINPKIYDFCNHMFESLNQVGITKQELDQINDYNDLFHLYQKKCLNQQDEERIEEES